MEREDTQPDQRLKTWKEIARFLDCSVKTAQRWEQRHALPIHRSWINNRVHALSSELNRWQREMTRLAKPPLDLDNEHTSGKPARPTES